METILFTYKTVVVAGRPAGTATTRSEDSEQLTVLVVLSQSQPPSQAEQEKGQKITITRLRKKAW